MYWQHKRHHTEHYKYNNALSEPPFRYDSYLFIPVSIIVHAPILLSIYLLIYYFLYNYHVFIISEINILLFINDFIHSQLHIPGSFLEIFEDFRIARKIHMLHHKYPKKFNYSLFLGYIISGIRYSEHFTNHIQNKI